MKRKLLFMGLMGLLLIRTSHMNINNKLIVDEDMHIEIINSEKEFIT